jgi:hypothetical protein
MKKTKQIRELLKPYPTTPAMHEYNHAVKDCLKVLEGKK